MSGKGGKSTGSERKDRLAAELRANLKRRKVKAKDAGTYRDTEANENDRR